MLKLRSELALAARPIFALAAGLFLAGCGEDAIRSYRTPKDDASSSSRAAETASVPSQPAAVQSVVSASSGLAWTAPASWKAKPLSALRKASYDAAGPDGSPADVSVIAFPGSGGDDLANINRWRGQLQLRPVAPEAFAGQTTTVDTAAGRFTVVDVSGAGQPAQRLIGAWLRQPGQTWFFKITGPAAAVEAQKAAFLAFLQSANALGAHPAPVALAGPPALPPGHPGIDGAAMNSMPIQVDASASLVWQAPADWRTGPPSAMRKATYIVGSDGAATLAISAFPGSVGGVMDNVNRWRGQVGLPPVDETNVHGATDVFVSHGLSFVVVDAAGASQRIVAALVPWQDGTWFFKLTGPSDAVAGAKSQFVAFLKTVHEP